MQKTKRVLALLISTLILLSVGIVSVSAATDDTQAASKEEASGIKVHYYSESGTVPKIYYWNSLPVNIETTYPGVNMVADSKANWFSYEFPGKTKINMLFIENGNESKELTRERAGEYWYKNGSWYTKDPTLLDEADEVDFREETIYFVITTRFYDGDTGNNVHCWDDSQAGNPDSDPAWRGDFQGLIDKLDYIKALGFSAIWITPVVTNASGYDYHGYHAFDFATVDVRYESDGATFQDLIDAAHEKDMKIVQDIVLQHTGNFGEAYFAPMFEKQYDTIQDLDSIETSMRTIEGGPLPDTETYYSQRPQVQYDTRLDIMKDLNPGSKGGTSIEDILADNSGNMVSRSDTKNANNYYHNGYWASLNWDDISCKYCQIAGDCVDLNTENPAVAEYLVDVYSNYANMGVDAFRVDTVRHMSRLSLNQMFLPQLYSAITNPSFYMFGEVCCRYNQVWYRDHANESVQFYTWKDDSSWDSRWNWGTDPDSLESNLKLVAEHYAATDNVNNQPTSDNAFLRGNEYHEPDYSQSSGLDVIDFSMHWNFDTAKGAFNIALAGDATYNDATWNVVYVDSHDYSPDQGQKNRFDGGTQTWAENLNLMYTFRGIPCLYYGSEIEFKKGVVIDVGPNAPLEETGRAYFGDHIEGSVTATDFGTYENATGELAKTLNNPLAKHIQRLSQIRRAVPALQKGQYSVENVSGNIAYKRAYTDTEKGVNSFVCVSVTDAATFTNIPNGTYIDAVSGDVKVVSNGTLTISASGKGNMRAYVLSDNGYTGISGKIGTDGTYLK